MHKQETRNKKQETRNKKQETKNKKKKEGAKYDEQRGCGCGCGCGHGCGAIRKQLSSQNAFVTFAASGLALSACTTTPFHLSLHSTPLHAKQ
jgi:hypothetical protein